MEIPLYQVDAFSDRPFAGNPAAICPLDRWLPDDVMQAIAGENNLSETAFFVPNGQMFDLRWFTPTTEVDLCGHATLASAHVIFQLLEPERKEVRFHTRSGVLTVKRDGNGLLMDFPAAPPRPCSSPYDELGKALGAVPASLLETDGHHVAIYSEEEVVRDLEPDMAAVSRLLKMAVIVSAPGREVDFVSRFFAPRKGVPEDPVTGSAHCVLAPYWAERLGRKTLVARQVSRRGGEIRCRVDGDRVELGGRAALYMRGTIDV